MESLAKDLSHATSDQDLPTSRQLEILRYVAEYRLSHGYAPSIRELCVAFAISSTNGIAEHLRALVRKRLLLRTEGVARGYFVTAQGLDLLESPSPPVRTAHLVSVADPVRTWRGGTIYIIEAVGTDRVKIGHTKKTVESRLAQLQTGCPYPLLIVVTFPGSVRDERAMHERFATARVGCNVEWFVVDTRLQKFIDDRRNLWSEVEE